MQSIENKEVNQFSGNETIENTESTKAEVKPNNNQLVEQESIEERYNKLKGLAVKLKKKVSELTEQNHNIQTENTKLHHESEELHRKILCISDSAKKLQTIQSQYDQLQDDIETVKKENKRLTKKLEDLVQENDSLKDIINIEKNQNNQKAIVIKGISEDKVKAEQIISQLEKKIKELNKEVRAESLIRQQKTKESDELKNSLDSEIKAHKFLQIRLDDMKHECSSNNVLSLEVANYEKSIDSIKLKLDEETNNRIKLEAVSNEHLETIKVLNARVSVLQDTCMAKTNRLTTLDEKNQILENDNREAKIRIAKANNEIDQIKREVKLLETCKKDLELKVELLKSELSKTEEENILQIKTYQSHIEELKREKSRLLVALDNSQCEFATLQEEFEGYKVRVQSVFLKNKNVSCNDTEEELELLKKDNTLLQEKLKSYKDKIESLSKEIILIKDERSRAFSVEQELTSKLSLLRQELLSIREKYKLLETDMEKLKLDYENKFEKFEKKYEVEFLNLKTTYENEIILLKQEKQKVSYENLYESPTNISSLVAPPLNEREECEGSENTTQITAKHLENLEKSMIKSIASDEPSVTLTPLDQLLENSFEGSECKYFEDDNQDIYVYKNQIKHLTELLADAEKDVEKLTQLNQILKEDIRRHKRYVKREEEAVNFEYLKNVVFKFITLENKDERSRLVPVLDTILKLSPQETHKLNEIVSSDTGTGVLPKNSWISGITSWSGT